jgi:hypothetical protein
VNDPITEARFWQQVATDSKRTVYCSPENESRIKTWVDARGMGELITVAASPYIDDGSLLVVDHQALDVELTRTRRPDPGPGPYRIPYPWPSTAFDPTAHIRITGTGT